MRQLTLFRCIYLRPSDSTGALPSDRMQGGAGWKSNQTALGVDPPPEPPFIPAYSKPDRPGICMNYDNTVSIYHIIAPEDTFDEAAQAVFSLLQESQLRYPDWPRMLYLDIAGHRDESGRIETDFMEFQQEFWFSAIAPFLTGFELPLTGGLINPAPQRNDLPDSLAIQAAQ